MRAYGYESWHQSTVGRIETGQRPLRVNELTDLATLFGVSVADLTIPKISLEEAEAEIAELEPALEEAKQKATAAANELASKQGDVVAAHEAAEEASYALNRIEARLGYLRRRRDALVPPKGSSR
jgi:multidrug resistance efflux pump